MTPALRFSTVSLLTPLLILLRQSKGFLLPSGQALRATGLSSYERAATAVAPVSPCRRKYLGLQQTQYAAAAVAEGATAPAYQWRGIWRKERRLSTMSAGGGSTAGDIDAGGDVRKRFEAMHSAMLPEGKEEVLRQASREAHNRRQAAVFDSKVDFFAGSEATPQKQFPSLRRIAEACLPDGDGRVVDAGCGTGALVPFLKEAGVQEGDVVGIDMSPEMGSVFGERFPEAEVVTADFIEFADEITALRLRPPPAATPAPPTPSTATAPGEESNAVGGGDAGGGGGGHEERIKRKKTAGDLIGSSSSSGGGGDKEQKEGRRRTARTVGGGIGVGGSVSGGSERERVQRKRVRTAGNVGGKRGTITAGDVGGGSGSKGSGGGQAAGGQDEPKSVAARESAVGTVVFNSVFGNLWDQGAALERAASILEEGGKVVISHPLGRDFVSRLKAADETVVPHDLPERDTLERMVQFLPFLVESFESGPELYLAVLKRTPHRASETVRYLRGTVSTGYGRGSKKLGVPTANLPESQFAENLRSLPTGVYFGWAALEGEGAQENEGAEPENGGGGGGGGVGGEGGPWKCVANVGYSPTFAGQENAEKIVEGHLIGYEGEDFYGQTMRMLLAGFQRSEKKFASFPELVATINKDVGDASAALDEPRFFSFKADAFFSAAGKGSSTPEAWSTRDFTSAMEEAAEQADKSTAPER